MRPEDEFAAGANALSEALMRYDREPQPPPIAGGAVHRSDDTEALVLRLVQEILEIEKAGPSDDFFSLGGDSMGAMYLVGRLREETGLPLRVRLLFERPRLGALAEQIKAERWKAAQGGPWRAEEHASHEPREMLRVAFEARRANTAPTNPPHRRLAGD
jgi:acyl carrier protein